MYRGTGGFHYATMIDNDHHSTRTDKRVKHENRSRRKNVCHRGTEREIGKVIIGVSHDTYLKCTTCKNLQISQMFENHCVSEVDRYKYGHNIICRTCQVSQYENGYKLGDFVISNDSNFLESKDSEPEHENWYESDICAYCDNDKVNKIKCDYGHITLCNDCTDSGRTCVTCDDLLL